MASNGPSSAPPSSDIPSSAPSSPASSTIDASSTILTTPSITRTQSTMIGTSNGQTFTSVVDITATLDAGSTVAAHNSSGSQTSSHTAAIVGGVIGGLAFLCIIAGLLFWLRRRNRHRTEFDGNFDPARVSNSRPVSLIPEMMQNHTGGGTLPRIDLDDEEDDGMGGRLPHSTIGGGIVTPFAYTPTASAYGSTRSRSPPISSGSPPPMSQHSHEGYAPTMSSASGYYAAVPRQAQAVGGYYPPAPPSSSGSSGIQYTARSAKEREAGGSGHLAVANPSAEPNNDSPPLSGGHYNDQYQSYLRSGPQARRGSQGDYYVPSSTPSLPPGAASPSATQRSSGVLVHQDGGRVEPGTADEIPPTYDSIPNEETK
ncbi:hypothetical protein R3P38DRAFT_2822083 [Favolaschia claudopus]|uniref:Uncharacterized protein n=1 Tax=Favolaschia claudopus TaxID=2862362 RepID=A0AAW0EIZ7_9AGAR